MSRRRKGFRFSGETFIFALPKSDFFFCWHNDTARFSLYSEELSARIGEQTNVNPATGRGSWSLISGIKSRGKIAGSMPTMDTSNSRHISPRLCALFMRSSSYATLQQSPETRQHRALRREQATELSVTAAFQRLFCGSGFPWHLLAKILGRAHKYRGPFLVYAWTWCKSAILN